MTPDYTYLINLQDENTQEPISIIVRGEHGLKLVLSRKPDTHTVLNITNIGIVDDADDYLKEITNSGEGLNFGNEGGH
jgi:hypothetical protein